MRSLALGGGMPAVDEMSDGTDLKDWDYEVDASLLPRPMYQKILVMQVRPPEKTRGGIIIPRGSQEGQMYKCFLGRVLDVGPGVGKHSMYRAEMDLKDADYPEPGDFVIFPKYQTAKFLIGDVPLTIMNEDEPLAIIKEKEATADKLAAYQLL